MTKSKNWESSAFRKLFPRKTEEVKLEKRLMNEKIWEEISEDLEKVKRNIAVLSSNDASMKKNVNKFPFLKSGHRAPFTSAL